jgi:hypothetical protein
MARRYESNTAARNWKGKKVDPKSGLVVVRKGDVDVNEYIRYY